MIHGIYVRSRPKAKWMLFSTTASSEVAVKEVDEALKAAKDKGHENPEAAIKTFETSFFIPQTLPEIKEQGVVYN